MRTVRISDEVWNAIAQRGKFGETPDDVLRRVFNIEKKETTRARISATKSYYRKTWCTPRPRGNSKSDTCGTGARAIA